MKHIKSCIIIYGWIYKDLNFLELQNDSVCIIIEPRKKYIDDLYKLPFYKNNKNIIIIKKVIGLDKLKECILYHDSLQDKYLIDNREEIDKLSLTKEIVYQTTFSDIISTYNIQNIQDLIININMNNLINVFKDLIVFNHIISKINIRHFNNIDNNAIVDNCKLFFENFEKIKDICILNHQEISGVEKSEYVYYIFCHRNLNIPLPNIAMYFSNYDYLQNNIEKLKLLIYQYQMKLIINNTQDNNKTYILIPYSDCVNNLQDLQNNKLENKNNTLYFEKIIENLENIFEKSKIEIDTVDIIIQFSPKFLNTKVLQIMYPLKDNILYVNKTFDIIYATKNCMYMLYQILKSKFFTDYIDRKRETIKPAIFKFVCKKYFYEYISKIFIIKEF